MDKEIIPTEDANTTETQTPNTIGVSKKIEVSQSNNIDESITAENMEEIETMPDMETTDPAQMPADDINTGTVEESNNAAIEISQPVQTIEAEDVAETVAPVAIAMPVARPAFTGRAMDAVIPEPSKIASVPAAAPAEMPKPEKKKKGGAFKTVLKTILVIVLIAGSGAGAYYYRDNVATSDKAKLDSTIASLTTQNESLKNQITVVEDKTTCDIKQPTALIIDNIKSAITSGNTAALEGYMASNVDTSLVSSGAEGISTAAQTVKTITTTIKSATAPWSFSPTAAQLAAFSAGSYGTFFGSYSIVGVSANSHVISFSFDCNAKINKVLMSSDVTSLN